MLRHTPSTLLLAVLLISIVAFSFIIRPVKAQGTIYIRADGSTDPPTAPISTVDNITYMLTDNISMSIVVQRDNILIDGAGYTVQGDGIGRGIDLSGRTSVTLSNVKIETFAYGIYLSRSNSSTVSGTEIGDNNIAGIGVDTSFNNRIFRNNITANAYEGVYLYSSSNNTISGNNITANAYEGVYLYSSSNNTISGNKLDTNGDCGIWLDSSSNHNGISGNNLTDNSYGICLSGSTNNIIFHNNFVDNSQQASTAALVNTWDAGYPVAGNYWSDYTGSDLYSGSFQNQAGSDGVGDTSYVLDLNNIDHYPLIKPLIHDVGITDVFALKTVVGQGYTINISVHIANYGEQPETFNVTTTTNSTIIQTHTTVLASAASNTMMCLWSTSGFAKGNYTVGAYAWLVPDETDTADNNFTGGVVTVTIPGDITGDFKVELGDLVGLAQAYNSKPGDARWNPNADIENVGQVDLGDLVILAQHYNQHYP